MTALDLYLLCCSVACVWIHFRFWKSTWWLTLMLLMPSLLMVCSVITTALASLSSVKRLGCTCEPSRSVSLHSYSSYILSVSQFIKSLLYCDTALCRVAWYQTSHCKYPLHWATGLFYSVTFEYQSTIAWSINNILSQALVEFFGTLSKEWALECMKDLLLVNLRGNLQIVVQVILFHFLFFRIWFPFNSLFLSFRF